MNSEIKATVGLDIEKKFKGRSRNKRIAESCLTARRRMGNSKGRCASRLYKVASKKSM